MFKIFLKLFKINKEKINLKLIGKLKEKMN